MSRRRHRILRAAAVLALVACHTDDAAVTHPSETVDSAGIVIVTNHRPAAADSSAWIIGDSPVLTLGASGAELFRVRAAILLDSTCILVASATELTTYDMAARVVSRAGGAGGGPGEFRSIAAVTLTDDGTIEVWDGLSYRSFFAPDLEHLRKEMLDAELMRHVARYMGSPKPMGDNSALISAMQLDPEPVKGETFRPSYLHAVVDLDSGTADTLLQHPGGFAEIYLGNRQSDAVLFSPRYHATVSSAGHTYITDGAEYEILVFDRSGNLVRIIRRSGSPRRVTKQEIESEKERRRAILERYRPDVNVAERLALLPDPTVFPAIEGLLVDREGYLWIREPVGPTDERTSWSLFSPQGVWIGIVTAPVILDLLDVGRDYILGLSHDELDREYVHLFTLHRTSA